jgi:S1-C subfamily serine protease
MENSLTALSNELASAVEKAQAVVVTVHARPRVPSSGVHWRPGVIVTAEHTLRRDEAITVTRPDGQTLPAQLAGRDPGTDLAVLKFEHVGLATAVPGDPESLRAGNIVLAVGRAEETGVIATMGVVSGLAGAWRTWRGGMIDRFMRLDVGLYAGSSGGALVDVHGHTLGIVTGGLSRSSAIGIPASTVNRVAEELLARGRVVRGYLGVGLQPVALPEHLTSKWKAGVIVLSVERQGPADRAGVLIGDVLLTLDDKPVQDTDDVQAVLHAHAVGSPVKAQVLRGGVATELTITIGERPRREE